MKSKVKFTATGKEILLHFAKTPRLCDVFEYQGNLYMVANYDGTFIEVVKTNKIEVTE